MKRFSQHLFALLATSALAVSSIHAAGSARENERLQSGKITKNEAQHLVLKKFPGAKVKKCFLTQGPDHSVWVLDVIKAGSQDAVKVQVDGRSGKIVP